ncbi:hypothetical protein GCM10023322_47360 [Rugosimonospora acidiphila]|uniref:Intracellular septation protein A n=1 Tax=Rugosimonospora acidiphila TaxID=556531 RepID=A0ABP9S531_9ACTN
MTGSLTGNGNDRPQPSGRRVLARVLADVVVPVAAYYGLRWAGLGAFAALLAGAIVSGAIVLGRVLRDRRADGLAVFTLTVMLLGVGVALISGSARLLLAREAWVTGLAGLWFIGSLWTRRPLSYQFTRPMLEGRWGWPGSWERLWSAAPRFRRMWRVSTVMWGVALLADAAARLAMAYTLPVDAVPALTTTLYAVTTGILISVTNLYYRASGALNRRSPLYAAPGSSNQR